jgi:hypothetical protein
VLKRKKGESRGSTVRLLVAAGWLWEKRQEDRVGVLAAWGALVKCGQLAPLPRFAPAFCTSCGASTGLLRLLPITTTLWLSLPPSLISTSPFPLQLPTQRPPTAGPPRAKLDQAGPSLLLSYHMNLYPQR